MTGPLASLPAAASAAVPRLVGAVLAVPAGGLDALLVWHAHAGTLAPSFFAFLHLGLSGVAAAATARLLADRTQAVLLGCGLAVMGPFGALAAFIVALGDQRSADGHPELEEWYRRLSGEADRDAAEILREDILEGRAYRPAPGATENFAAVIAGGSVAERQAVLGLLVQHDERGSLDLMTTALRSRDVAVRASAAAAVARMREMQARHPAKGEGAS